MDHSMCFNKNVFDRHEEHRTAPKPLDDEDVIQQVQCAAERNFL